MNSMANGKWHISYGRWWRAICLLPFAICHLPCRSLAANDAYYNYLQGMVEERSGNANKALEAYEKAVKQDPQALQVYRDIAELRLRMGQPDAALSAAERVKELAPKDSTSFIFLGNVWVAQGNLAKAAEAYEQALKLDPTNLRALENLGNYYALLDPDKSLAYYQRYVDLSPRDADIHFQMAIVEHKKGHLQKALARYQESIALDPSQLASHLALAELYEQQYSTAAALEQYAIASQLQPSNPLVLMRSGNLLYRNGKWDDAQQAYLNVQKATPEDPTVYYWLARVAEEKKNWKEAAADAEKAFTLSKDPQFLPLTAYYMTLDHQVDNAIKYLEMAKKNDPDNANVLLFLGMNYLDLDKADKAQEALSKGVTLYPKDVQMRFHLGMTEDRLGHFDAATAQFEAILKLDSKNTAAMNYLGYSWADRGMRLEEAEKLLKQAVALEPDNGAYLDSLGWVRYKRGDAAEASHYLEQAVLRSPDPLIYDHLGDAYMANKHPEAALQAWSKVLSVDTKNEAVRKKLLEEGGKFFSSPDASKYLLYLEGNLKQAQNLSGGLTFNGHLNKHGLQAAGKLYFAQPDKMLLDVAAGKKTGPVKYSLIGSTRTVDPPGMNPALNQMAFDGLASLSQFLSGNLKDSMKASVDSMTGVQTQFSRPNPSGGQDEISVVSYDYVEGLWLPIEIHVKNSTTGWSAELLFSDWVINNPDNTRSFQ